MPSPTSSFATPGKTTTFPNGQEDLVAVAGSTVARLTLQAGWRWSNDTQPLTGVPTCGVHHRGYCLTGTLHVEPDEGTGFDIAPGELYDIAPGHDAWVVGEGTCVLLDWLGKADVVVGGVA